MLPSRLLAPCVGFFRAQARFVLSRFRRQVSLREFVEGAKDSPRGPGRVLLVLNHAIRERHLFESIRGQILELMPGAEVAILDYRDPMFVKKAIVFRPHATLTFPFTALTIADTFYPIKFLTGCSIVTYRAEGGLLDYSGVIVDNTFFVGYDRYGSTLVDRELFWGSKMASYAAPILVKQGKLSSPDRIGVVGYPEYECYFDSAMSAPAELPREVDEKLSRYPKERTVLLVTGFHASLYTREEVLNAKDWYDPNAADSDAKLKSALQEIENTTRFKQRWIEKTLESARANPDVLHVLKCHPLETLIQERKGHDPYAVLNGHPNILYVQNVPLRHLLRRCGFFLHYGSTALAESIILKIPSAFVYSEAIHPRRKDSDFAKLSTLLADISDLPGVVAENLRNPVKFELTREMERALFEVFNISKANLTGESKYRPSREIASVLVGSLEEAPLRVEVDDPYLLRAMRLKASFFGLPMQEEKILAVLHRIARHRPALPGRDRAIVSENCASR